MAGEKVTEREMVEKFNGLLETAYKKKLMKAATEGKALEVDFIDLDKKDTRFSDLLLKNPGKFFDIAESALELVDLPGPVKVRIKGVETTNIRDLRSRHINKFLCVEGTVRKASEIRPEIVETIWECPDCGELTHQPRVTNVVMKPFQCSKCGNKQGLKQVKKNMIDTRWIVVEEPFELTEGDRPSQLNILLTEDLVSPDGRRMSDPGNRLKITGILREIPKGKYYSVKLDFFLEGNHVEPTEMEWIRLEVTEEDKKKIREYAKDPMIYERLVDSLAPSMYGLRDVKEAIILQLFGGIPRLLKDGTRFRGNIHILLVGDPSSGKSMLLKLVPEIVPRARYVSGKGASGAGLCMSYDTLVPMAHGEIRKIGDIVEDALSKGKRRIKEGWVTDSGNESVIALDDQMKIRKRKVSSFFKLNPKKTLVEIETSTGRKIKVTKENPLLVIENGELRWKKAEDIRVNECIALARKIPVNHLPVGINRDFARFSGMIAGDGDVGNREVRFHNTNDRYLDDFSGLSIRLGYKPRRYYQGNRIPCIRVASKSLCDRLDSIGIPRGIKCDRIRIPEEILRSNGLTSEFLSGLFTCDGGPVEKGSGSYIEYTTTSEILARQIQTSLLRFEINSKLRERPPSKKGYGGKKKKYVIVIRGQENLKKFRDKIGFTNEKKEKLDSFLKEGIVSNTNIDLIPNIGGRLSETRKGLGFRIKNDRKLYLMRNYEKGRMNMSRKQLLKFVREMKSKKNHPYFDFLERLGKSDIFWDRVVAKRNASEEWVYDLTVKGEHNFVANDIIVHNTATVTKDEQFMGGWVLEAGALVLTNKGLLAIDEFEKMSIEDQVAMHEGLEQGTVSIAKASIVATLPANTSVLAGGNPKFSRFDPYLPIVKQITIPDTLLTRFDLKFVLRDIPNAEEDRKIVDHVLQSREGDHSKSEPAIPTELVKKYIAYARENHQPKLSEEAGKLLRKFYINTRKKAEGGGPVPITLRQFEGLIRLSEASAKVQLRDDINTEDAQRAIRLMRASLTQLGLEPESGMIDIDRAEGAMTTSSERSKIRIVMDMINELSEKSKEIPMSELQKAARQEDVENLDEIIEKLKREGMLFEPNPGYVQKV